MQVWLVDTFEGTQVGTQRRARPLAGVAMDLALAITMIIPRPFAHPMGNRGMARLAAAITLPFVGIEPCAVQGHMVDKEIVAGLPVRVVADPQVLLAHLVRDDTDDGRTIVGIGAVPFALIGTPPGRISGVAMRRAFFHRGLVQLIGLKGGAHHHGGGVRGVHIGLDALPQGMELLAR
jgi:hypothetical protein